MKYKPLNQTREFEFSNGMIGRVGVDDISIYEDNVPIFSESIKEAKQIHEVLGDLLGEICKE
jgi:hypothetical protein